MQILSVTLRNFKAHSDRFFEFKLGTNAISGENGAGKTTILEAIAWTLFNHRGDYRVEDLIRNGSSSAQATVTFISSRDDRTYQVQRCTQRGYTLHDPQLNENLPYKHIEDEVLPWLRQQLGVPPGTNLARLFANTIGVPQGTFTAAFLESAERRKQVFDNILKVEEYKQTSQQLLSLEKYAKSEVEVMQRAIAQYEETLESLPATQTRCQELETAIATNETLLNQLETDLEQLQTQKEALEAQAQAIQALETQRSTLNTEIASRQRERDSLTKTVDQAQQSVQRCEVARPGYDAFLAAESLLKDLNQQQKALKKLTKQRDAKQKELADQQTTLAKLEAKFERLKQAETEFQQLQTSVTEQEQFEQDQAQVVEQLQQLQAIQVQRTTLEKEVNRLRSEWKQMAQEIDRLTQQETAIAQIPEFEQQRDRLQLQLSRIEAAQQFHEELQQLVNDGGERCDRHHAGVDDILASLQAQSAALPEAIADLLPKLTDSLESGVALNIDLLNSLRNILNDLADQTSAQTLKKQRKDLQRQLDLLYQQRAEVGTLAAKQQQQTQIQIEGERLSAQVDALGQELVQESALQERRSHLATALTELGNPRGQSQLLQQELRQQASLTDSYTKAQESLTVLQTSLTDLTHQMADYQELDSQIEAQQQTRQTHQTDYQTYLQHQNDAQRLPQLEDSLKAAIATLDTLNQQQQDLVQQCQTAQQDYDADQFKAVSTRYTDLRRQADQLLGGLPQQRQLLAELQTQVQSLRDIAEKRDRAKVDLKQKERIKRFISFSRKVYKEAGPRITERYVQAVSREADRLCRELLNRSNVGLEWTRDYEILVQEGANTRRFINLSGGEQMCAALSVRLALLRVLSEIDIAFFDEPTTNMDRPRRQNLAEAIANVKSFKQLFIISHDDTFEQATDHQIVVERDA